MLRSLPRCRRIVSFFSSMELLVQSRQLQTRPLLTAPTPRLSSNRTKIWCSKNSLPKEIRTVDKVIYAAVDSLAEKEPSRPAIVSARDPQVAMTFLELKKSMKALESFLYNCDFKKGDVATVLLPNCCEYPVILTAVMARGGVVSTAPHHLTEYEINTLLRDNQSKIVFAAGALLEPVIAASRKNKNIQTIVAIRFKKDVQIPTGIVPWDTVMEAKGTAPRVKIEQHDLAALPYSSGTTGIPKGVMLTHRNLLAGVNGLKVHYEKEIVPKIFPDCGSEEAVQKKTAAPVVVFLPFYHIYGLAVLLLKVITGATVVQLPKFDPGVFLTALQKTMPWELAIVPPVGLFLAKHPVVGKFDLSSIRFIVNGAANLPEEVALALKQRLPNAAVVQAYGLTETVALSTLPTALGDEALNNVGVAGPGVKLKITDKYGQDLGTNERGEIAVSGENIMSGYYKNLAETKKVIRHGWFFTGDIGFVDDKEQLHVVDRIKELIKVKGLQVAPALLESQLLKSKRIADVAVIGVPHPEFGEVPKAFVVRADPDLTEDDVKKTISDKLAKHNWLEGGVDFVLEIPKSQAGKILRRVLRNEQKRDSNT